MLLALDVDFHFAYDDVDKQPEELLLSNEVVTRPAQKLPLHTTKRLKFSLTKH